MRKTSVLVSENWCFYTFGKNFGGWHGEKNQCLGFGKLVYWCFYTFDKHSGAWRALEVPGGSWIRKTWCTSGPDWFELVGAGWAALHSVDKTTPEAAGICRSSPPERPPLGTPPAAGICRSSLQKVPAKGAPRCRRNKFPFRKTLRKIFNW